MENAEVQKKPAGQSPSVVSALWDPFGFMQAMFSWGRPPDGPLFEVEETDSTYVCKVKVPLTLPDQADVAHAQAKLDSGELTLVVPKAAVATPEPTPPPQSTAVQPEPESPPRTTRRAKGRGKGNGSARRTPGRGARTRARRG